MALIELPYTGNEPDAGECDEAIRMLFTLVNGNLDGNNLSSGQILDAAQVANALDARGCTLLGDMKLASGVLIGGVDITSIATRLTSLEQVAITTSDGVIILAGLCAPGTDLEGILTTAYPDVVPGTTHRVTYHGAIGKIDPLQEFPEYTLGKIEGYVDGSDAAEMTSVDRKGNSVSDGYMSMSYLIAAVAISS